MSLFCFLFVPALYFWRRSWPASVEQLRADRGSIVGFLLGAAVASVRFLSGESLVLRGTGISAFVPMLDGLVWDGILPLLSYLIARRASGAGLRFDAEEAADWMLAWIAPVFAFRALYYGASPDAVRLVAMPILYSALALSWPYWIGRMLDSYGLEMALSILAFLALPLLVSCTAWLLFTNRTLLGAPLLLLAAASAVPAYFAARRRAAS